MRNRQDRAKLMATALICGGMVAQSAAAQGPSKYEEILPASSEEAKLQALTPEKVQASVAVRDDDLDTTAELTTSGAYRSKGRFTDPVRSDTFVRAFISKASGKTTFQVYQEVSYNAVYRQFTTVNYATPTGPVSAPIVEIAHEVVTCAYGSCAYKDTLGFGVEEDTLRMIAGQYVAGKSPYWRFRVRGRAGVDWNDRIMPAEVAGLLKAVGAYRAAHPVSAR